MNFVRRVLLPAGMGLTGGIAYAVGSSLLSPLLALAAIIGLAAGTALLLQAEWAFLLSAFVIPIERLGRFADDSTMPMVSLMRIVGLAALASYLLHAALRKIRLRLDAPLLLYGGYVLAVFATLFYAIDPAAARTQFTTVLGNTLFLFLIINIVRDWRLAKLAVVCWLVATVIIGFYQLYDWHFGQAMAPEEIGSVDKRFVTTWDSVEEAELGSVRRATGTTSNAAVYGINLLMTAPFFLFFSKTGRTLPIRVTALGCLLVVIYNLLLTNTRAVMLFGAVAILLCIGRKLLELTPARIGLGVAALLIALALLPAPVYQRALDLSNYSPSKSYNLRGRFYLWQGAVALIGEHWMTGVGGANWHILPKYLRSSEVDTDAIMCHNEYLQTMVDVGIAGWCFFVAFLTVVLLYAHRAGKMVRVREGPSERYWFLVACQISLLTVYLFGVQVDVFHFPLKGWWLLAGISGAMYRELMESRWVPGGGEVEEIQNRTASSLA
ncbi:MAG: O-antigen ligase family protein [Bryobacterales bacterium]|nr:O-antigen ligase family protein [Bryobacterales bacterium]